MHCRHILYHLSHWELLVLHRFPLAISFTHDSVCIYIYIYQSWSPIHPTFLSLLALPRPVSPYPPCPHAYSLCLRLFSCPGTRLNPLCSKSEPHCSTASTFGKTTNERHIANHYGDSKPSSHLASAQYSAQLTDFSFVTHLFLLAPDFPPPL